MKKKKCIRNISEKIDMCEALYKETMEKLKEVADDSKLVELKTIYDAYINKLRVFSDHKQILGLLEETETAIKNLIPIQQKDNETEESKESISSKIDEVESLYHKTKKKLDADKIGELNNIYGSFLTESSNLTNTDELFKLCEDTINKINNLNPTHQERNRRRKITNSKEAPNNLYKKLVALIVALALISGVSIGVIIGLLFNKNKATLPDPTSTEDTLPSPSARPSESPAKTSAPAKPSEKASPSPAITPDKEIEEVKEKLKYMTPEEKAEYLIAMYKAANDGNYIFRIDEDKVIEAMQLIDGVVDTEKIADDIYLNFSDVIVHGEDAYGLDVENFINGTTNEKPKDVVYDYSPLFVNPDGTPMDGYYVLQHYSKLSTTLRHSKNKEEAMTNSHELLKFITDFFYSDMVVCDEDVNSIDKRAKKILYSACIQDLSCMDIENYSGAIELNMDELRNKGKIFYIAADGSVITPAYLLRLLSYVPECDDPNIALQYMGPEVSSELIDKIRILQMTQGR